MIHVESLKINFFLPDRSFREEFQKLKQELSRLGKLRSAGPTEEFGIPQFFLLTKLGENDVRRITAKLMLKLGIRGSFTCQKGEKHEYEMELA